LPTPWNASTLAGINPFSLHSSVHNNKIYTLVNKLHTFALHNGVSRCSRATPRVIAWVISLLWDKTVVNIIYWIVAIFFFCMLHYILNDQLLLQSQPIQRVKMIHLVKQLRYSTLNSITVALCLKQICAPTTAIFCHIFTWLFRIYNLKSDTRYSCIHCYELPLHFTLARWVGLGALWFFRLSWVRLKLSWGITCMFFFIVE